MKSLTEADCIPVSQTPVDALTCQDFPGYLPSLGIQAKVILPDFFVVDVSISL